MKGFTLGLALKQRQKATWKSSILLLQLHEHLPKPTFSSVLNSIPKIGLAL